MKVKDLVKNLKGLDQELELVYSVDDEGNAFNKIYNIPTVGYHDGDYEFLSEDDMKNKEMDKYVKKANFKTKAVCIN